MTDTWGNPTPDPTQKGADPGFYPVPGTDRTGYWDGTKWTDPPSPTGGQVAPIQQTSGHRTSGTNGLSIAALVLGIVWGYGITSVLAIIFGLIGMRQTRERDQAGRGMAIAGFILGIIGAAIALIIIIAAANAASNPSGY